MSAESQSPDVQTPVPVAAIAGITATVAVFAISQGLSYPLLSFILLREGVSPGLIGLSAAMTPLGFIVSSPVIPLLARRFGPGQLAIGCSFIAAALLATIAWQQDVWLWFPLRFLLGFFANPLYVISETWMVAIAPPEKRGRIMGVYTSMISAGFACGPLTLTLVGTEGWAPFLVGIGAFVTCGLCLLAILPRLPSLDHGSSGLSVGGFVRLAPLLILAVFVAAAFEQALLAMFSVYGQSFGSSEQRTAAMLSVFIAGNIVLQVPLGALAERIGAERAMLGSALAGLGGALLLPVLFTSALVWPMVFVWGAVAFGIYTLALIQLGERFTGAMIITGNAAFALAWGIGGIAGAPAIGVLMNTIGPAGLPIGLATLCGLLVVALAIRLVRRRGGR